MKWFYPDAHDYIDPGFDFELEQYSPKRDRQRTDRYAHEYFRNPPYDGLLVSMAIVEGVGQSAGKYSMAQAQRLKREGVREFFRLGRKKSTAQMPTLADCGAFSYVKEEEPPVTPEQVLEFYDSCGFDMGMSVDHVIPAFDRPAKKLGFMEDSASQWQGRREISLQLAREFLNERKARGSSIVPVGVAQGWSAKTYADSVRQLQQMGYERIALGGLVPLKTQDIVASLAKVHEVLNSKTQLHLLGVTRLDQLDVFKKYRVTSFDSTSPLRQAFMDARNNYYLETGALSAIRIPQVQGNPKLSERIKAGEVDQDKAVELEARALKTVREFARSQASIDLALEVLDDYYQLFNPGKSQSDAARTTLAERPWERCKCKACKLHGIEVVIFRGSERNRRRGFHNMYVFSRRLSGLLSEIKKGKA